MPAATLPSLTAHGAPLRKRFTRAEVQHMLDSGLFAGERYELINGDLIDKMGQNPPHATGVRKLMKVFAAIFGADRVLIQLPIEAGTTDSDRSLPEPDVAVLKQASDEYEDRHPRGDELLLVVEVSDTTAQQDSTTKRDLYARAGVPEYWVLDVSKRALRIHRRLANGLYGDVTDLGNNDVARLESEPGAIIPVADLLPKQT